MNLTNFERLSDIMSVLSDEDALKILHMASDGLKSGNTTAEKLGMTRRQYYRKLKELTEAKILKLNKRWGNYKHTALGKILHQNLFDSIDWLLPKLDLVEKLSEINDSSEKATTKLFSTDKTVAEAIRWTEFKPARICTIRDYERMVQTSIREMNMAEKQVLFATRFLDLRMVHSFLQAVNRGVILHTVSTVNPKEVLAVLQATRKEVTMFTDLIRMFASDNFHYKFGKTTFSFQVVDGRRVGFELGTPKEHLLAFLIDNKEIADELTETFWHMWKAGKTHRLDRILEEGGRAK